MRESNARPILLVLGAVLSLLPLTGCPPCNCGDESALGGTWELTGEALDPSITNFFIELSSNGEINGITYKINNITFDYRDAAIVSFADVEGSNVEITANWATGEFIFTGTFNETKDVIEGSITYEFHDGLISIRSDLGQATLTKQ